MAICSEDTTFDLDDAAGFIPVEKYPNKSNVMEDEVGAIAGVRFIETTNAKVKAASGADGNDVHCTIVFAKNAYAQSRISGLALQNIVKPIGSGGSEDPLDQRGTSGWKASYVARILDQTKLVRIEHGVSDS
jgi:N4-gp56 family major capsid protein